MSDKISLKSLYMSYVANRIKENEQIQVEKASALNNLYLKYAQHFLVRENVIKKMWRAIDDGFTECVLLDELEQLGIALFVDDLKSLCTHGLPDKAVVSLGTLIRSILSDEFEILYKVERQVDGQQRRFMMVLTWCV